MLPQNIIVMPILDIYTHRLQIPFPLISVLEVGQLFLLLVTDQLKQSKIDQFPAGFKTSHLQEVIGGEGGIRTHAGITPPTDFESAPLWPLRYLSMD